ncbi:hypothetical protein AB0M43_02040 [Longispora sp. NPDC051575]|uniref:hypothetical protein n=1 Tax=Longispora sp. NPDC051575 TaxID=3154943 RepID=UPI003446A63A
MTTVNKNLSPRTAVLDEAHLGDIRGTIRVGDRAPRRERLAALLAACRRWLVRAHPRLGDVPPRSPVLRVLATDPRPRAHWHLVAGADGRRRPAMSWHLEP